METHAPVAQLDPRLEIKYGNLHAGLRALPRNERMTAVIRSIESGDEVAAAALCYPAFTAGIEPREQELIRAAWSEARFPAEVRRLRALREAETHLDRAGKLAGQFATKLYSSRLLEASLARAHAAEAAIAAGAA